MGLLALLYVHCIFENSQANDIVFFIIVAAEQESNQNTPPEIGREGDVIDGTLKNGMLKIVRQPLDN